MTFDLAQWKRDYHAEHDVDEDAPLPPHPEPEVRARPPEGDELPGAAKTLLKKVDAANLAHHVWYARGTWIDQYGKPADVRETCVVTTREAYACWVRVPGKMVNVAKPHKAFIGPMPQKLEGWKFHSAQIRGVSGLVASGDLNDWLTGQAKPTPGETS